MCLFKFATKPIEEDHVEEEGESNVTIEKVASRQTPYLWYKSSPENTYSACIMVLYKLQINHLSFSDKLRMIQQLKRCDYIELLWMKVYSN